MTRFWSDAVPVMIAVAALGVSLVGSGFANAGLVLAWIGVLVAVIAGLAIVRPAPQMRVFGGFAALALLFLLGYEGGWWLMPAVVADMTLSARRAGRRPQSEAGK